VSKIRNTIWLVVGFLLGNIVSRKIPLVQINSNVNTESTGIDSPKIKTYYSIEKGLRKFGYVDPELIILKLINSSNESIYVKGYSFTNEDIVQALIKAKNRGVSVNVLLDRENESRASKAIYKLYDSGIRIFIRDCPGLCHNKFMVFDSKISQTGSANYSKAAFHRNDDEVTVIEGDTEGTAKRIKQWYLYLSKSHPIHLPNRLLEPPKDNPSNSEPSSRYDSQGDQYALNRRLKHKLRNPDLQDQQKGMNTELKYKQKELKRLEKDENRELRYISRFVDAKKYIYFWSEFGIDEVTAQELASAVKRGVDVRVLLTIPFPDYENILKNLKGVQVRKLSNGKTSSTTKFVLIDNNKYTIENHYGKKSFSFWDSKVNMINSNKFTEVKDKFENQWAKSAEVVVN